MLKITDWHRRYEVNYKGMPAENGDKLRAGPLKFIRLKVFGYQQGVGLRRLKEIAADRTMEVFGIFCKFLEIAGDQSFENRGRIFNENGQEATVQELSFILDIPENQISNAITVLCRVGWLESGLPPLNNPPNTENTENQVQYNSSTIQRVGKLQETPRNSKKFPESKEDDIPYVQIIAHLNKLLKDHNPKKMGFKVTEPTKTRINARWREGYRQEDFEYVHQVKFEEWFGDPKMEKYLCPETLYSPKFEKYRNQVPLAESAMISEVARHNMAVGRAFLADLEREELEKQNGDT